MDAVERLRRDHRILRAKLDVLENALGMGPDAWFVLREVCFTLGRQLQDHIRREEALVTACRQAMDPNVLAQTAVEHHDEPELLRGVNDLFGEEKGHSLERIRPALAKTIEGLRRHMAQEEAELFPVLERTLAGQHAGEPPPGDLHETMTVNQVLQQFPQTRRIFDRLFINVPMEGCTCLDEVAWCHGMEARELMDRLKEAVAQHEVSAAGG